MKTEFELHQAPFTNAIGKVNGKIRIVSPHYKGTRLNIEIGGLNIHIPFMYMSKEQMKLFATNILKALNSKRLKK